MKGYGIEIKNNLLEPKHVKAMGSSIWEYMWILDHVTMIDEDGIGHVFKGAPFKLEKMEADLGLTKVSISRNLSKLKEAGYIHCVRTAYGVKISVNKAHKRFNNNVNRDLSKKLIENYDNDKSNKTVTIDSNNKTITNVIKKSGYGNENINLLTGYFLKVFQIPKEDITQGQSRRYWNLLLKESKTGVDGVKWLIDLAHQDEFYANNITSSKDLYYKRVKLIARRRGGNPQIAVMQ